MKIAMIAGNYPPTTLGGGEISTQYLAEALHQAGDDVSVLTCGAARSESFENGVDVRRVPSPNIYWRSAMGQNDSRKVLWHILENWNPRSTSAVSQFLKASQFDLVVTSTVENFGAGAWTAAAACGVPSVHILRSYFTICWRGSIFKEGRNCEARCFDCRALSSGRMHASQLVDGVVGISRHVLDAHISEGAFRHARTILLPDPSPDKHILTRPKDRQLRTFGYLGVLSPNKGLESLALAWDAVSAGSGKLLIGGIGAARYEPIVKALFSGNTVFSGWVNAESFLDTLDFLIVPSIWREPFGRIIVEAYSRGTPVIAARTGGIPEMVNEGRTGFLFTPGDPADLARTIARASSLPLHEFREMSLAALCKSAEFASGPLARRYQEYFRMIVEDANKKAA